MHSPETTALTFDGAFSALRRRTPNPLNFKGFRLQEVPFVGETFLMEQGFSRVEHGVVGPSSREIEVSGTLKSLCRTHGARRLVQELQALGLHTRMASSRAVCRNGESRFNQSGSDTKARLMLIPCFNESEATRSLVRSTSAA